MIASIALSRDDRSLLDRAYGIARRARSNGNHPFGALIANNAGEVLLEGENTVHTSADPTAHAEVNLIRKAAVAFTSDELRVSTMYVSAEPCAMCSGAAYWAGLGRIVYGLAESELFNIIGANKENLTMRLGCRAVFSAGHRSITIIGPVEDEKARSLHEGFWSSPTFTERR